MATVSFEHLRSLPALRQFYTLTWRLFGVNIFLVSPDGASNAAFGDPPRLSDFCLAVQARPGGRARCEGCDREHIERCRRLGEPHRYRCHAGLTEFIVPIVLHGEILAYIQCGQVLDSRPDAESWRRTRLRLESSGLDAGGLDEPFRRVRVISPARQRDLVMQLELIGNYMAHSEYTILSGRRRGSRIVAAARAYIGENLAGPIDLDAIAEAACVSRRTLTRTVRQATGRSVVDLLTRTRLAKACRLLADPQTSCTRAAFDSGFSSIQNFNRAFRKYLGCTPSRWRIRHKAT